MKPVEVDEGPAYTGAMTSCLSRLRARRSRRHEPVASDGARPDRPIDPTRPAPVRIEDGVPIAHAGPPGFPGAPLPVEDEAER